MKILAIMLVVVGSFLYAISREGTWHKNMRTTAQVELDRVGLAK